MPQNAALRVAEILTSEGYSAFLYRYSGRTLRLVTDAPAHVVASVHALVTIEVGS